MKVIELAEPYMTNTVAKEPIVLALGFFDGVHRGHQAVIKTAAKKAQQLGVKLAVMTFDQHPSVIFQKKRAQDLRYLTTLDEKLTCFEELGADIAYIVKFDEELAYLSPQTFVDKYIVGLHAKAVVAGQDYTYGPKEKANMQTLPLHAKGRFEVVAVDLLQEETKIGSTAIRKALDQGDLALVTRQLGHPYTTKGVVVHGFERGRKLGFPTLNIETKANKKLPAVGVYAVKVKLADTPKEYMGMASIGYNETFGADLAKTLEVNLFDFSKMVYGKKVTVFWEEMIREMVKFSGVAELVAQLEKDKANVEKIFRRKN